MTNSSFKWEQQNIIKNQYWTEYTQKAERFISLNWEKRLFEPVRIKITFYSLYKLLIVILCGAHKNNEDHSVLGEYDCRSMLWIV